MSVTILEPTYQNRVVAELVTIPNIEDLITEDDTPVDNIFSAKQQRLLVDTLYNSWSSLVPFFADANVGVFSSVYETPLVPDVFVSLNVQPKEDVWAKRGRSYFLWEFGKPPDIVVEIVSNKIGNELDNKLRRYARMGVTYYVVFDPVAQIQATTLTIYGLQLGRYRLLKSTWLKRVGLGVTLWTGTFEGLQATWLRWCDAQGQLLGTGGERIAQEQQRVIAEQERVIQEQRRAERYAAKLRALGIDPESE
jgi:Uma2 family endonuclease